jgi:hypothetical protein
MNQSDLESYVAVLEARCLELESKVGRLQEGCRNLLESIPLLRDSALSRAGDTTAEGGGQPVGRLTKTKERAILPSKQPAREDPAPSEKARRGLDSHEAPLHSARLQRGSSSCDQVALHEGGHERGLGTDDGRLSVRQTRHGGRRNRTDLPTEGGREDQSEHILGVPQEAERAGAQARRNHTGATQGGLAESQASESGSR